MENSPEGFSHWRDSLARFLGWFEDIRAGMRQFYVKLGAFFVALNLGCFWWALLTTRAHLLTGDKSVEYVLIGFPVALLGAVFDVFSLFVTLFIVRRALASASNFKYVGYLSVDLLIAVAATFWVLFAFMVSGWLIGLILAVPETLAARTVLYESRFLSALYNPFGPDNIKNIYFGVLMGASALLPTLFHLYLAGRAFTQAAAAKIGWRQDPR